MANQPVNLGPTQKGVLGWIERSGNALPDPVFIFFWLIGGVMALSALLAALGASVAHPISGEMITVTSLFAADNLQKLVVDMPKTFTHFHPLGYVLVVMLGAGVAERTGLFSAAMRASVANAPRFLLTPAVALVAMVGNLAADAAYVVLIPLAAVIYASAGRHPLAGIATAFAGVSGGFSANLIPGQLDALLFGITQAAVESSGLHPGWVPNIAGNTFFIQGMLFVFLPIIWFMTDNVIEPRLGAWTGGSGQAVVSGKAGQLEADEKKGLAWAGLAMLAVIGVWLALTFGPGTPLINEAACPSERAAAGLCSVQETLTPFYQSLVAAFLILFLAAGWAYGAAVGTAKNHRDIVRMMSEAMSDLGYYLVLAFAAAHFVAMFNWSNMGLVLAVEGAGALKASGLPAPALLAGIVVLGGIINLFIGSASAKWALLAPILVPMLMLLGISPEMSTAAYRMGDSATNAITPLMVYFPLVLTFCQRWVKGYGLGSLMALMIPYGLWMSLFGIAMTVMWVILDLPLGPGAAILYTLPGS